MIKLIMTYDKNKLFCATENDQVLFDDHIKKGDYEVTLKSVSEKRKHKSNSFYWVLLSSLSYHKGLTTLSWHKIFKAKFLNYEKIVNPLDNEDYYFTNSTAFDKLSNEKLFKEYLNKVVNEVSKYVDVYELIETYRSK